MKKATEIVNETVDYWRSFYAQHSLRHDPSEFCRWCIVNCLKPGSHILELGCGNARDSFAFLHHGFPVLAVDGCEIAIADNIARCDETSNHAEGRFHALDFSEIDRLSNLVSDVLGATESVYTRFVLHAIPEALETRILEFCYRILPIGGRMMHEFRTIRDPLMKKGIEISKDERLTDHYRRFLNPDVLREKLVSAGWRELFFVESNGLASFGDDDPVVARIVVEKL